MLIQTKEQHIQFIDRLVINIKSLIDSGNILFATLAISQSIEIIGAYLDGKPFRSKEQSSERFNAALYRFFFATYSQANKKNFLYQQLRTSLVHTLTTTESVRIHSGKSDEHLSIKEDVMNVYVENYYEDFCKATEILKRRLLEEKIKTKKMSVGDVV